MAGPPTDLAAPRPLPPGRPRDWVDHARDGALMAFFVSMAFSISASQGLLALLCVLVLASPTLVSRPGSAPIAAAETWEDLASLRRHPLTPPFLAFAGL